MGSSPVAVKLDKACLQHEMVYRKFKDFSKRTASDKVLRDKAFNIAKNPEYDGYQRGLVSMVYIFLIKSYLPVMVLKLKICQTKN